jgi:HNH endonuclease/MYM-type Zinc finger with FCS sequence motif
MSYEDNFRSIRGPYSNGNGKRKIVIVEDKDGKKRTVSLPKWLVEKAIGRELDPDMETVDHWDSNIDNNDLSNLRVVPRAEHSADDTRRVKPAKLECALCKKQFERNPKDVRDKSRRGKAGPFCSRSCAGKYGRMFQLKLIEKFDVQPLIDSEYYKRKYASLDISFVDLFIEYLCEIY